MSELIMPALDAEVLKQKATEFALKGALQAIENFYTGYNSPYKKQIEDDLQAKGVSDTINLPDIMALISEKISKEMDIIANKAIATSFIPLVQKVLSRVDKEVKFSEILEKFIEVCGIESRYDCSVEVDKHPKYDWLSIELSHSGGAKHKFTLHTVYNRDENAKVKYQLLSLPEQHHTYGGKMTIRLEKATLEMPFCRDILMDEFVSYLAQLAIYNSHITMDVNDFEEEMFKEECHC
jgi:hypothetical protein